MLAIEVGMVTRKLLNGLVASPNEHPSAAVLALVAGCRWGEHDALDGQEPLIKLSERNFDRV